MSQNKLDFAWFFDGYSKQEVDLLKADLDLISGNFQDIVVDALTMLSEECQEAYVIMKTYFALPDKPTLIKDSPLLLSHAQRVCTALQTLIGKLEDKNEFLKFSTYLSCVHCNKNIKSDFILGMMGCLRQVLFDRLIEARNIKGGKHAIARRMSYCNAGLSHHKTAVRRSSANLETIEKYNQPEFDTWNKLFMTISLSLINGMERTARSTNVSSLKVQSNRHVSSRKSPLMSVKSLAKH